MSKPSIIHNDRTWEIIGTATITPKARIDPWCVMLERAHIVYGSYNYRVRIAVSLLSDDLGAFTSDDLIGEYREYDAALIAFVAAKYAIRRVAGV